MWNKLIVLLNCGKNLRTFYEWTNGAKLFCKEHLTLQVITQIKKLLGVGGWGELNPLNAKSQCTCGAKENLHKAEQDRRFIQFLVGLNEVNTIVRGSILMIHCLRWHKPFPC